MCDTLFARPLFVGAHMDDIELFAGATLARFEKNARCLVFSTHDGLPTAMPEREVEKGKKLYPDAIWQVCTFDAVDGTFQREREPLAELLREYGRPSVVITHQSSDTNQDHRTVYEEVVRVFKGKVPILCGSFPNNDLPAVQRTFFVTVTKYLIQRKLQALANYESQRVNGRTYFDEALVLSQARVWGSLIGEDFAEAFEVVRLWV